MERFPNISYLHLGNGEGLEICCRGLVGGVVVARWKACPAVEKMLIEMINYRRFIGGDSVS